MEETGNVLKDFGRNRKRPKRLCKKQETSLKTMHETGNVVNDYGNNRKRPERLWKRQDTS